MPPVRDTTIDIAKGLAIVAIVLGHVLRGLEASGVLDGSAPGFALADRTLYMGHLTVFAFLSGLFISRGVERRGPREYLTARLALFLYLYLLWQTLQVVVKLVTASQVNHHLGLSRLWEVWRPEGQMWFLPWLVVATLLVVLTRVWEDRPLAYAGVGLGVVVSCATWAYNGPVAGTQGLGIIVFFVCGAHLGYAGLQRGMRRLTAPAALVLLVVGGAGFTLLVLYTPALPPTVSAPRGLDGILLGFLATCLALVAVVALSALLARGRAFGWLAFLGQRSLEIFLAHITATAGTRIVLSRLGADSPAVQIAAGTLAGVVLPLLLWWIASRWRIPLFALPPALERALRSSSSAAGRS
jgi:fucose 4-O-acetylase-like acetyltransferase